MITFATMSNITPWYMKDKWGYPIEFTMGSSFIARGLRIFFMNIQKLGHKPAVDNKESVLANGPTTYSSPETQGPLSK